MQMISIGKVKVMTSSYLDLVGQMTSGRADAGTRVREGPGSAGPVLSLVLSQDHLTTSNTHSIVVGWKRG